MRRTLLLLIALLTFAGNSLAATVTYLEAGTDATQDFTFYVTPSGTFTSDSTVSHTGPRSVKLNTSSPATVASATAPSGVLADAGRRISWWFRISTVTPSATSRIATIQNSSGTVIARLRITTGGKLLLDNGSTTIVTGTTVLSANTWYRITWSYTIASTSSYRFDVYINGTPEFSGTPGATLPLASSSRFALVNGSEAGANVNAWYDDIYIDDGSDYSDPGDIRVTAKRPFANGTTNGFTTQIGSGGSGYGTGHAPQVNEQPLSQTNGWSMVGAGLAITEEYNVEGAAVGDVDVTGHTIYGVEGWVLAKSAISETGSIVVTGSSSNISLTSTATLFFAQSASPTTFPVGTGTDIGIVTSTTVTTVSLYEGGILIAFSPYTTTPAASIFFLAQAGR